MKKKIFLLFIFIVSYTISYAQNPQEYVESFFLNMERGGANLALDSLFKTNELITKGSIEKIDNIKNQLQNVSEVVGGYYGAESLFYDKIGQSVEIHSYLVRYEAQPLRFTFIFYKCIDKWRIYNFQFDSNLIDKLYEKSKIYLLENKKR